MFLMNDLQAFINEYISGNEYTILVLGTHQICFELYGEAIPDRFENFIKYD